MIISEGFATPEIALTLNRCVVGAFFAVSGYHKIFCPARHAALSETLAANHIPLLRFNSWFVPGIEFLAGTALLLGIGAAFAATLLGAICLVACVTDGRKRVASYSPIDGADRIDDWLYLPEVLYGIMLLTVILAGPGYYFL